MRAPPLLVPFQLVMNAVLLFIRCGSPALILIYLKKSGKAEKLMWRGRAG